MNLPLVIFLGGIATYLLRSAGLWLGGGALQRPNIQALLDELPFAVILVLAVSSGAALCATPTQAGATGLALGAIALTQRWKLPVIVSLAIACLIYGALVP